MSETEGSLTATQYEILKIVWSHESEGAGVAQIWQAILAQRPVA